jgi:hypothetical protein
MGRQNKRMRSMDRKAEKLLEKIRTERKKPLPQFVPIGPEKDFLATDKAVSVTESEEAQ